MAQGFYKLDVEDAQFPLLSEQQTRTVITSGTNQSPPEGERPGLAYCHNVMPTPEGYNSVGFESVIPAIPGITVNNPIKDTKPIFCTCGGKADLSWDSNGHAYILTPGALAWKAVPDTVPVTTKPNFSANDVTIATVNGISYIFHKQRGCFTYSIPTNKMIHVPLTGLAISYILGIASAGGYLVAYTTTALAWSSAIDPSDFVPSSVTGAGGGNVQDIGGLIQFVTSNDLGLLIYTGTNVVAATVTGNAISPFKFRPVSDSKGGLDLDKVALEANSREQFAYTKAGLQSLTSQVANNILPQVTDFLAGRRFEDFDEEALEFTRINLDTNTTMKKKIKYISSRYLVISYGIKAFTHALIYDTALNRLGKIKLTHTDVFEYVGRQKEISKESVAILLASGEVMLLDFSVADLSKGVMIFGKLQHSRTRVLTLLGAEVENVGQFATNYSIHDLAAIDGKQEYTIVHGIQSHLAGNIREHVFRVTAKNHSLVLIGRYHIVTILVRYTNNGRR